MAYDAGSVDVGESTKKSAYDQLLANDAYLLALLGGLQIKTITIGAWNMNWGDDGVATKDIAHGLADMDRIRAVFVVVKRDDGGIVQPLGYAITAAAEFPVMWTADDTNIALDIADTASYNNVMWDHETNNRGWVTILYEE